MSDGFLNIVQRRNAPLNVKIITRSLDSGNGFLHQAPSRIQQDVQESPKTVPDASDWNVLQNPRIIFLALDLVAKSCSIRRMPLTSRAWSSIDIKRIYPSWSSRIGVVRIARACIDLRAKPLRKAEWTR